MSDITSCFGRENFKCKKGAWVIESQGEEGDEWDEWDVGAGAGWGGGGGWERGLTSNASLPDALHGVKPARLVFLRHCTRLSARYPYLFSPFF